ncbi:MAG TPA: hypothetical protein VGN91_21040 [Bosea sp. (in: a-proteobacteria)]|jgi:hypothetical protein|nr:hypothetical protein [Bosea sp. (in: a-proteobacteria)]
MAGQAASRAIPFDSDDEPQRCADRLIQVKASPARALNHPARLREQTADLPAPKETQP